MHHGVVAHAGAAPEGQDSVRPCDNVGYSSSKLELGVDVRITNEQCKDGLQSASGSRSPHATIRNATKIEPHKLPATLTMPVL